MKFIPSFIQKLQEEREQRAFNRKNSNLPRTLYELKARDAKLCIVVGDSEIPWWCGNSYEEAMEHWVDAVEAGLKPDIIDFKNKTAFNYEDLEEAETLDEEDELDALLAEIENLIDEDEIIELTDEDLIEITDTWEWLDEDDLILLDEPTDSNRKTTPPTPPKIPQTRPRIPFAPDTPMGTPALRKKHPKTKETIFRPFT